MKSEKLENLKQLVNEINVNENSFEIKNEEEFDNSEIKIVYLKKDDIPQIKIKNKNFMSCDEKEIKIKDYLKQIDNKIKDIKDNSFDLIDDYIYDRCRICKVNLNKFFCINCEKNLCEKCIKECIEEKHMTLSLNEIEKNYKYHIEIIKTFLNSYIIPIKDEEQNQSNDIEENNKDNKIIENEININCTSIPKIEEGNEDILLIIKIISINYNNYFHYKNIMEIINYCISIFPDLNINYNGKGKIIFHDGRYYIGQFKDNLRNGKGILYNKNGNILYEGEYVNGNREGKGKLIFEDDAYYIGQFKDNLQNGKGIEYYKNGNIKYEGEKRKIYFRRW